jgi:hypothetical protein
MIGVVTLFAGTDEVSFFQLFPIAAVAGVSAFWTGGILGYLFGIPRRGDGRDGRESLYKSNTNLEEISDWLTKIVVGLGLVEMRSIGRWVSDVGSQVADAAGLPGQAAPLMVALLAVEAICGFIFFYLWSRLYMPRLFRRAEKDAEDIEDKATKDQYDPYS